MDYLEIAATVFLGLMFGFWFYAAYLAIKKYINSKKKRYTVVSVRVQKKTMDQVLDEILKD